MILLPTTWQFIRRYPYLIPFLFIVYALLFVSYAWIALKWLWTRFDGILRASCCEFCPEDKWICLVACETVSTRLELVDAELDRVEAEPSATYHQCRDCPVSEGCNQSCLILERWEMRQ